MKKTGKVQQVYVRRRAIKEGAEPEKAPKVEGEARYWTESAWEDPQQGFAYIRMEKNDGIRPKADVLRLEIAPHTVQTVTFPVRCPPPAKK